MLYGNAEENWPCSEAVSVVPVYILFGTPTSEARATTDQLRLATCQPPALGSAAAGRECSLGAGSAALCRRATGERRRRPHPVRSGGSSRSPLLYGHGSV